MPRSLIRVASLLAVATLFSSSVLAFQTKSPVPDAGELSKATQLVDRVYKEATDAAKSRAQKLALAKTLVGVAKETEDAPGRYVLLQRAADVAAKQGDSAFALATIDELAARFDIDSVPAKARILVTALSSSQASETFRDTNPNLHAVINAAIAMDRFDLAGSLVSAAIPVAREARDNSALRQFGAQARELERLQREFAPVAPALDQLRTRPADPTSNLDVGLFRCFVQGDWKRGIPFLALSSDDELRSLAGKELEERVNAEAIADGWWKYAEEKDNPVHSKLAREHAVDWYSQALITASGVSKLRFESRIRELCGNITTSSFEWVPGKPAVKLARENDRVYALSGVSGAFEGGGERIQLVRKPDKFWYLEGFTGQPVTGNAISIQSPTLARLKLEVNQHDWTPNSGSIRLIHTRQGFCTLSILGGAFEGGGERVELAVGADGYWYLTGHALQPVFGQALSFSVPDGESFVGEVKEFVWKQGDSAVRMIHRSEGFCYLSGIGGTYEGGGEAVRVAIGDDGFWHLTGNGNQPIFAKAIAIRLHKFGRL